MKSIKYYKSDNNVTNGIRTITLLKISENEKTYPIEEEFQFLQLPDEEGYSMSFVTRQRYNSMRSLGGGGMIEIDPIEYETIICSGLEALHTFERLTSYFSPDYFNQTEGSNRILSKSRICSKLGIKKLQFDYDKVPKSIQDMIPWISLGEIMVTKECLSYLKALREDIDEEKGRNRDYFISGIDYLIQLIKNEEIRSVWEF